MTIRTLLYIKRLLKIYKIKSVKINVNINKVGGVVSIIEDFLHLLSGKDSLLLEMGNATTGNNQNIEEKTLE